MSPRPTPEQITEARGHPREVLKEALRRILDLEKVENNHLRGWPDETPFPYPEQSVKLAARDAVDPVTLAELMAEALRECTPQTWHIYGAGGDLGIGVVVEMENDFIDARMTHPQARAALLRILELPEGATAEEAVEALQCK